MAIIDFITARMDADQFELVYRIDEVTLEIVAVRWKNLTDHDYRLTITSVNGNRTRTYTLPPTPPEGTETSLPRGAQSWKRTGVDEDGAWSFAFSDNIVSV